MESPTPSSRYIDKIPKKRVFPGGSSSSAFKEAEILETMSSSKTITCTQPLSEKKEVACEVLDSDLEEDCENELIIDRKAGMKRKGKEISTDLTSKEGSKNVDLDDPDSDFFFGEDEWTDAYYDEIVFDDDTYLQSQFDHMDIPTGVEVLFPWLPGGPQMTPDSAPPASPGLKIEAKPDEKLVQSPPFKKVRWADKELAKVAAGSMLETGLGWGKSPMVSSDTSANLNSVKGKWLASGNKMKYPGWVSGPINQWRGFSLNTADRNSDTLVHSNLDEILRDFEVFKKFDTSDDCSDHYHAKSSSNQVNPPKNWAKRIQAEWKILEKDLPDKIFVRVYESRMDLLRAVIVGAKGTPYEDGLFFFDFHFTGNYPNSPPQVHYLSGGLRLNPNLYNCGKVCLSLLNTWSGKSPKERWIPGVSTMLQVLVSIQGLILNAEPYYNEPGHANSIGTKTGQERSLHYNEKTFLYSLQTMVYTMRRPPKHFESLVVGHFCKHARDILVSCRAYLLDAKKSSSDDFKHHLSGFINTLIDTFSRIGAKNLEEFLCLARNAKNGPPPIAANRILRPM